MSDPSGYFPVWDIIDFGFAAMSWGEFASKPSWRGFGMALLDTTGCLPILPSTGYFTRTAKAVNKVDAVVDTSKVASKAITNPARMLEAPKEVADHHIIPAFRGKSGSYADFISKRDINVDLYTITVSAGKGGQHMNFIHGKGKWNPKWMSFIDNNPNATSKDIFQFVGKRIGDYGLSGYNILENKK